MKPQNKFQKRLVEISGKIPKLTQKQIQFAKDSVMRRYATIHRGRVVCMECNHRHELKDMSPMAAMVLKNNRCSNCSSKLTLTDVNNVTYYSCYAIYTRCKEYQVVRIVYVTKHVWLTKKPQYVISEIIRHFIDENGNYDTLMKQCYWFSHYYQPNWQTNSEFEPRTMSMSAIHRKNTVPDRIYPYKKILPALRRNGFMGNTYDIAPQILISELLVNPKAETLIKARQYDLLHEFCYSREKMTGLWPQVKLCIRHSYKPEKVSTWVDLISMLQILGRDINNPKVILPRDLISAHHYINKLVQNRQDKIDKLKRIQQIQSDQVKYEKQKSKYFGFFLKHKNITIQPLRHVEEIYDEGKRFRHCVFNAQYHLKQNSLLLSARVDGEPVETIEVNLKTFSIKQSRGMDNQPTDYNAEIVHTLQKNMHLLKSYN